MVDVVYVLAIDGVPGHKAELDERLADPSSGRADRARLARELGGD